MRIGIISEHASPLALLGSVDAGGQNAHVAELSIALAGLGHEIRVYTRRDDVDLPELVPYADGVDVVHVPAGPAEPVPKDALLPYMKEFSRALVHRWRDPEWTPEIIHAHFWMSGLAAVWASRELSRSGARPPVVLTYHALGSVKRRYQGPADTSPPTRIDYERALGRSVDRVVAQCGDEVAELALLGVPADRITVIPSGVDLVRFAPEGPRAERAPGRPRLLSVGRMVERKGFADLVQAMTLIPDAECVVVGGPPAAGLTTDPVARRLRELADGLRIGDRVRLVGAVPREEMAAWYRSADVVVCAPWYEPFGLTPLEAMACGVPVVASAVGGLADTVVDQVTGVLVRPRDPRALAAAVRRLLADPPRRAAFAAAALERARAAYSWHRTATRLSELYAAAAVLAPPERGGDVMTAVG